MVAERLVKQLLWAFQSFTPNGDGYNDYWNVKGLVLILMANPSFIFSIDLENFKTNHSNRSRMGWYFTGNRFLQTIIGTPKLEDGREVKGHFSLKR
jgi:gliding motility-associated-like protein